MKFRSVVIALILVFCASAGLQLFAEEIAPMDVELRIISGQIKLTRVGATMSDIVNTGVPLYAGDLIETLRESRAELVYGDGTKMRVVPLTLIEIQPTSIRVFKGRSWFRFVKRGSEFVIETPSLVAGIRGTSFEIAVSSHGKSVVAVMEGAVAVKGKADPDRQLLLRAGYSTHCDVGGSLVMPYQFDVERKNAQWRDADWETISEKDVNQLFINYLNLKNNYGENDSRTTEALRKFEEGRQKLRNK